MSNLTLFPEVFLVSNTEPESEIFSETRPNRSWLTKIRKFLHDK